MLPATGILTMSPSSRDGRCENRPATTAVGNLCKMVTGTSPALVVNHDTAAMSEVREEVKLLEATVVTVVGLVKIGPAAHEEDRCEFQEMVQEMVQEMAHEREDRDVWVTTDETLVATTGTLRGSGGAMSLRCRQTTGTRG